MAASIFFLPDRPEEYYFISHVVRRNGYRIADDAAHADVGFHWKDTTIWKHDEAAYRLSRSLKILNFHCTDISKRRVGQVFEKAFGYDLLVDPLTFDGSCVRKSDANYTHDGQVVEGPIEDPAAGMVYCKLVSNHTPPNGERTSELVYDLRTPFFRGIGIPYVLVKYKLAKQRFGTSSAAPEQGTRYEIHRAEDLFDASERRRIESFCGALGLDVGELDILRDDRDSRIYIVDANNTPAQPSQTLSHRDAMYLVERQAEYFERMLASCTIQA